MADIPGEYLIGPRFQRTARDQSVVNGSAADVELSGFLQDGNIFFAIKAHESEPGGNIFYTDKRLFGCRFVRMGEPCERGIHLRETVRCAPVSLPGTGFVELDTGLMMGMVSYKNRDKNGRIEKSCQLKSSETAQVSL